VVEKLDPVTAPEHENAWHPEAYEQAVLSVYEEPESYAA